MEKILRENLHQVAHQVLSLLPAPNERGGRAALVTLSGDLGAGKTTFVQALARELGVAHAVQSPTYVLMKKYPLQNQKFDTLVHIDAYRLSSGQEFAALDPQTFLLDERALVVVEWPERIEGALPEPHIELEFSSEGAGEGERYMRYKGVE